MGTVYGRKLNENRFGIKKKIRVSNSIGFRKIRVGDFRLGIKKGHSDTRMYLSVVTLFFCNIASWFKKENTLKRRKSTSKNKIVEK